MVAHITENQLVSWVHRLTHLVAWLSVATLHTLLLCVALFALYILGISGNDIYSSVVKLGSHMGLEQAWQALSFFGVSGFAVLAAYAIAVKKLILNLSLRYLFKYFKDRGIE